MTDLKATPCDCPEWRRLTEACADLMRERDEAQSDLDDALSDIEALRELLDTTQTAAELLAKDAVRYRWLRESSTDDVGCVELRIWIGEENGDWQWPTKPNDVDDVIDAAMQEAQK